MRLRVKTGKVTNLSQIPGVAELIRAAAPDLDSSGYMQCDSRIDVHAELPNYWALYRGKTLLSLITLFSPRKKEVELSAITHPEFRRLGYFNRLFILVVKTLRTFSYESILFVTSNSVPCDFDLPAELGLTIEFSEYLLVYDKKRSPISTPDRSDLTLRRAESKDRDMLIAMNATVFPEDAENTEHIIDSTLNDESKDMYILYEGETPIGTCATGIDEDIFLYSLGIRPSMQGRGYGKLLINRMVTMLEDRDQRILLEADSENSSALRLYQNNGFSISLESNYYRLPIEEVR